MLRRRADHPFYQGLLGFPLAELFENRDYKGSTHLFFDLGHDNTLAFFDFPDLGLEPYSEVLGGFHHLAISVDRAQWDAARARLDEAGIPTQIESEISLYFSDPDGVRLELIAEDLGSLYGTPAALMPVTGLANLAVKVADLEQACAWYEAAGATVTEPVEWENGRRADVQLGALALTLFTKAIYEDACALPGRGVLAPRALRGRSRRRVGAPRGALGTPDGQRHVRHAPHRVRGGARRHPPRVHGADRGSCRADPAALLRLPRPARVRAQRFGVHGGLRAEPPRSAAADPCRLRRPGRVARATTAVATSSAAATEKANA